MFRYLLSIFLFSGGGHIDQNGIFDYNVKKKKKKKKKVWQEHKSLVLGRNNNHRFSSVPNNIALKTLIVPLYI